MPAGNTRPFGHQGLVDGDTSGSTPPPPTPGFLSTIYAAGLADDPAVDNLMTGPLQQFFINLGSTPPPFPPNAQPFFPESAIFIGESPADSGIGADAKPLIRTQRHFSTFPSDGEQIWFETRYDLFGGGINTIAGGDRQLHWLIDQFDNRLAFAGERFHLSRPGLNAPGYTPTYLDNAPVTYVSWEMMDALGSGNTNVWTFNSDGAQFRRVFIPNTIGPGGGPAGPWNYIANGMSLWSRNGGEPLIGSRLYYDAVTAQTFGDLSDDMGQLMIAHAVVLDVKNLGSGQAGGHGETWVRSTLGGPLVDIAEWFDDGPVFPIGFGSLGNVAITGSLDVSGGVTGAGGTFAGGLDAGPTTITGSLEATGLVNFDLDLQVAGEVDVGELLTAWSGASVPTTFETPELDFATLGSTATFNMPTPAAGTAWLVQTNRLQITARDGTVTTGPVIKIGNNGAHDNWIAAGAALPITTTVKNAWVQPFGTPALAMPDASGGPLVAEVATAATLGTATVFKGKLFFQATLVTLAP